ncbi:MAG: hypothetical protein KDA96_02645 [Planctomycetaceae bacterium]|nr:hypothetical protein [Planctomycetaceae bacterium]
MMIPPAQKSRRPNSVFLSCVLLMLAVGPSSNASGESLPIREISVFKDGHAFVMHQGPVTPDRSGTAALENVPTPILGTFWIRSDEADRPLLSASAGQRDIATSQPAKRVRDFLYANSGAEVLVEEGELKYTAHILEADPASEVVLFRTEQGVRAVPTEKVTQVTFTADPRRSYDTKKSVPQIELAFDALQGKAPTAVQIQMTYLQRGIRWIPAYRMNVTDRGVVEVTLQATVINDLADLKDVKARFLVGVPSITFKDSIDPIALKDAVTGLSGYFQSPTDSGRPLTTNFSNSIMIQSQGFSLPEPQALPNTGRSPNVPEDQSSEDLYVFTVPSLTLPKGHRGNLILGQWELPFEDIYKLDVRGTPPVEFARLSGLGNDSQLKNVFDAPKVEHVLRITNSSKVPLTTAPVLFLNEQTVLAQGMMTYTAPGNRSDVTLTMAVGISSSLDESETERRDERRQNQNFFHVTLSGSIRVSNAQKTPVRIEVIRNTLGTITNADHDAGITHLGPAQAMSDAQFDWFSWYSWPYWWHRHNSFSRAVWKVEIPAGESIDLQYSWRYTWVD